MGRGWSGPFGRNTGKIIDDPNIANGGANDKD